MTTYGIAPYSAAELNSDPQGILARQPTIVSQFRVTPQAQTKVLLPVVVRP